MQLTPRCQKLGECFLLIKFSSPVPYRCARPVLAGDAALGAQRAVPLPGRAAGGGREAGLETALLEGERAGHFAVRCGARCHAELCSEQGSALCTPALAPRAGRGALAAGGCQQCCLGRADPLGTSLEGPHTLERPGRGREQRAHPSGGAWGCPRYRSSSVACEEQDLEMFHLWRRLFSHSFFVT